MANERAYLTIKNFKENQHYKSRNPIWIKLYIRLLRSDKLFNLTNAERWIYIGLLLAAAIKDNLVLYDLNFLKANICHYETTIEELDAAIKNLIKYDLIAIKMIADCYQNDIPEKSRVEKSREEYIDIEANEKAYKNENEQIVKIIELFKTKINPVLSYGHKTQRQSVVDLLALCGGNFQKLIELTEFAISIQGKKYAPVITTPYKLKEKFGDLLVYYKRETNSEVKILGL